MTLASVLISTRCSYPTTFEELWHYAAFCGLVLSIATCLIFWQRSSLKYFGDVLVLKATLVLMIATLAGSLWAIGLAIVTSQNYLICDGIPEASADLIQRSNENYQTLLTFQSIVGTTSTLTFILTLISIFSLLFMRRRISLAGRSA